MVHVRLSGSTRTGTWTPSETLKYQQKHPEAIHVRVDIAFPDLAFCRFRQASADSVN